MHIDAGQVNVATVQCGDRFVVCRNWAGTAGTRVMRDWRLATQGCRHQGRNWRRTADIRLIPIHSFNGRCREIQSSWWSSFIDQMRSQDPNPFLASQVWKRVSIAWNCLTATSHWPLRVRRASSARGTEQAPGMRANALLSDNKLQQIPRSPAPR
jgi:hypothetical protein